MNDELVAPAGLGRVPPPVGHVADEPEHGQQDRDAADDRRRLTPPEAEVADAVDEHGHPDPECECQPERRDRETGLGDGHRLVGRRTAPRTHTVAHPASASAHPRVGPREARAGGEEEWHRRRHHEPPHRPTATGGTALEPHRLRQVEGRPRSEPERGPIVDHVEVGERPREQEHQ